MGLYRRGKIFWFSMMQDGKRIQVSTKTKNNRRLAEKIHAKALTELQEGRWFETQRAKSLTFRDMVAKYSDRCKQRDPNTLKMLLPFFGDCTLDKLTPKLIGEYRSNRLMKVKPATVYQELALLRRMFNVAIKEWEWVQTNPVSKLSFSVGNSNARDRWLTLEEESTLIAHASPEWLKDVIRFALHTGMRRGEILSLMWKDVDFHKKLLRVEKTKNNEKRSIPMSNTIAEMLKGMKIRDISGKVFPVTVSALKDGFERAVKKAGIENFHFHDLRHTFATRLVQNGIDIYVVKELLGHKTITMTMRYAHHYPESLRHGVEVLDRICYNSATVADSGNLGGAEKSFRITHGSA